MTKRLFIAFPVLIDSSLQSAIKRARINAQQKEMEFNWVPEANFHVTLCFLGNTAIEKINAIELIMKEVASETPPLKTSLRGMGAFPDDQHMRALWIGVRKSRSLGALQEKLSEALSHSGFSIEDREYIPHLTIGRLRKARSGRDLISPYVRSKFGDTWASSMTLFESILHGSHPVYKPLFSAQLTGAAQEDDSEFI